jgi:hypothetical protein
MLFLQHEHSWSLTSERACALLAEVSVTLIEEPVEDRIVKAHGAARAELLSQQTANQLLSSENVR